LSDSSPSNLPSLGREEPDEELDGADYQTVQSATARCYNL